MNPKFFFSKSAFVLIVVAFAWAQGALASNVIELPKAKETKPWAVSAGSDEAICTNGNVQLQATGANSYTWSPSTGLSCSNCPNPVAAPTVTTTYVVTGDDGTFDDVKVSVFTPPVILNVVVNQPTDCNLPNGSIAIITLGNAPYEYSINGGTVWQNNGVFTALPSGTYNIVVRGNNGACSVNGGPVTLTAPASPQILNILDFDPTFCDVANGSIIISATGGIAPLQYSVNAGQTWQNGNIFQLLPAGIYQVRVRNANGSCQINGPTITLDGPPDEAVITEIFTANPTSCEANNGQITIVVPTNGSDFEYSIDGGASYFTTNGFFGLMEGEYQIRVRRLDGSCVKNGGLVTLVSSLRPTIYGVSTVNPLGCGSQSGNITVLAFGPSTLQFSINGGATWQNSNIFSNLIASNNYEVAVRNLDGTCVTNGGPVVLTDPGPPVISAVVPSSPTTCGVNNGTIQVSATGAGQLEYSVNNGATWQLSANFNNLAAGSYTVLARYVGGGCTVAHTANPVLLTSPGTGPNISAINVTQPAVCGVANGAVSILASGSGPLSYSINGGSSFQQGNTFNNLGAGTYPIVVAVTGGTCTTTATASLVYSNCTDTLQVSIPASGSTNYCIPTATFNNLGTVTSAGFCGQGGAATVAATSIAQNCVTLVPAAGFTGVSPDLICTVHCFNNTSTNCDTTYLQVVVQGAVNCNPIFQADSVAVPFTGNPTNYCVQVPLASLTGFDLYLNGTPLNNPNGCNFVPTTAYSYTLLPGAGFGGPYSLDTWTVNGNSFSGFFNNANELLTLMQTFDPSGNWAINTTLGLVFGGNPATNYGDMEVTHLPSGTPAMLNINTTSLPTGFDLALTSPGFAVLIAENPLTGCADTLVINSSLNPTETDTIFLTTTVNTPTTTNCLSGSELPGGNIVNVGYCQSPDFGVAPLSSPNCVFYIPSLNFAGQDAFCMVACDGGFPQVCDTTYFFVNVLPQNDTVYLTIPAGENSIDSCLTSFVVELPGPVTSASFCSINTAEISGTVAGNCLTFTGNGNFYGTTTACVSFCSGGFCEENTVIVTIVPPVACDEVFDETTLDFTSATPDNFLCIPIPTGEIVNYQVTIDGVLYTQSFTPCGFDVLSVYDVSGLPAGPFTINSWTENGNLHTGVVANLAALVGQMNAWDPNGGWVLNAGMQSIQGGQGGTYSNLVITPAGGATQTLARSLVQLPLGSQVAITGFGNHLVSVTAANGCSDNVTVVFNQQVVTTETLVFNTTPSTSVGQLCANTDDLIGNLFSVSPCGLPSNGAFVSNTATCFTYTPNLGFIGSDTACVVVCDDNFIPVCDTFIFIINVEPVTDTLFLNLGNTAAVDTCLGSDFIQLSGVVLSSSICGANQNEVTLTLAANCVNIDLADNFTGTTTACVVHCDDSTPPICDTTYLVITNTSNPNPCPTLFNPDEVLISLQSGVGEVCLPISPVTMMGLSVILDGQPVSGQLLPCNVDQVVIYAYGQVFGQGAMGPYSVAWTINGQNFSSVVQNMQGLVDQMNIWDNVGNWNIEQPTFSIISTNDNGVYGNLIITHIATGLLSTIAPAFNGLPLGTAVPISGAGQHTIIVENPADGCSDTLTINALNGVDQLDVFTSENVTSNVYCIDTLGLPGTFEQMSVCQLPANGIIAINENCFSFTPNTGFIGADAGCLVVCDNLGNCDTTLLNITVGPLCSLFDVFPDTTAQIQVASCADIAGVCTPILLDSIANYGVLDNGFPYAGNFVVCNGQFAQVALDTGLHEVVFLHLATGCQDTLFVLVSCTDDDGCGTVPLSPLTLQVDDCNDDAQFCVSVPVTDLPNFLITDNGAAFGGNIGFCDLSMTNVGLTVDTGLHVLILEDTVKGCADTFVVNVLCTIIQDVTVDTLVPQGNTIELCLEDFGYLTSDVDSVAVVCASNGNTSYVVDEQTWCITFTGEEIGLDTACFEVFVGDTSAIFTVNIEVISPCPVLIPGGVLASSIDCSLDSGLLCLPFDIIDLLNKTMELDGVVYPASQLQGCGLTSIFRFNYDALPSQGLLGPYILENWNVNGTDFTGVFNTIQELADSMNLWDPSGNWQVVVDPNTGANLIQGGDASNNYGNLTIEQQISGIQVELGLGLTTIPTGIAITLEVGLPHTLTITDTLTNCTETAILELVCLTSDVVQDTIMLGAVDTFCLDLSELLGDVASVTNLCPGSNGEIVGFTVDSTCVIYEGNEPGLDSACFVVCDVTGLCDTTYFFVMVGFAGDSLPIAVDDIVFTDQGNASNINVLGNDTVQFLLGIPSIVEPPLHGDVQVLPDGTINYVPTDPNYCDEDTPDSFTYSICNPAGCDTATVFVTIFCSGLSIVEAFSPNGDNKNETFKITGLQNYPGHHLYIYNRWGLLVHEATNYLSDWEGTYKDKILPDGTYFYVLDLGTGDKPETGFVVILR